MAPWPSLSVYVLCDLMSENHIETPTKIFNTDMTAADDALRKRQ
jgi:hypothetical protein